MIKLNPDQHFVYCWRYENASEAKIGVSRVKSFGGRIQSAENSDFRDVELLGIALCGSKKEGLHMEKHFLNCFERIRPNREWIYLTDGVWEWLNTKCIRGLTMAMFREFGNNKRKILYNKNPMYREKHNVRQRERYHNNPEYRERHKTFQREKYHNDPEYRKKVNDRARERHRKKNVI